MLKTESQFDIERVTTLGDAKYGPRFTDRLRWAREANVSVPTLRSFLAGDPGVKLKTVDAIVAPFGLSAAEIILPAIRKKGGPR